MCCSGRREAGSLLKPQHLFTHVPLARGDTLLFPTMSLSAAVARCCMCPVLPQVWWHETEPLLQQVQQLVRARMGAGSDEDDDSDDETAGGGGGANARGPTGTRLLQQLMEIQDKSEQLLPYMDPRWGSRFSFACSVWAECTCLLRHPTAARVLA